MASSTTPSVHLVHVRSMKVTPPNRAFSTPKPLLPNLNLVKLLDQLSLLCHSRANFGEDLMQGVAHTANMLTVMFNWEHRAAPVPASDFQQHGDGAKQKLAATAAATVRDLSSRFLTLEHAKGLVLACARPLSRPVMHESDAGQWPTGASLVGPAQAIYPTIRSVEVMCSQAEHRVVLSSAAADPAKQTKLWRYLAGQPIIKADISEYIKLAELALVMTPGSVEEERMSSAMAFPKDYSQQAYRCSSQGCWPFTSGLAWLVRNH
ncbi:hypothetical protein QJQ45_002840 [Haematococcus lacustris]|nr:hypothetical protein QJQ45_002840 [Haematococcus lacustris]